MLNNMENLDSVCYINKISKIEPIDGADKIELCTVNGWTSVTQKGVHKEGDLILCITTDAVIPKELATKWGVISYLRNKSRVRTVKLRGVYSECILIPLKDLTGISIDTLKVGIDMMSALHIFKYEPPVREVVVSLPKVYFKWNKIHKFSMWKSFVNYKINKLKNKFKKYYKDNVHFDKYYKFPNQKNTPHMFNELDVVVITRKMHGTNARYGIVKKNLISPLDKLKKLFGDEWIEYEYVYGSHNVEKGSDSQGFYSTDVWQEIADKYQIKQLLWEYVKTNYTPKLLGKGIIIYGEIFGPGIQKNYDYGYENIEFEAFDIQFNGEYLSDFEFQSRIKDILTAQNVVDYLYEGSWSKEIQDKFVFNNFIENSKVPHEGVVVKCISGDRKKISKVINPDYLTYGEKHGTTDSH
jgi:hypothetical protein